MRLDFVVYTGDMMSHAGDEPAAEAVMTELSGALRPRYGQFGVYGNHDTEELARRLEGLPIEWLRNRSVLVAEVGVELVGLDGITAAGVDPTAVVLERDSGLEPGVRLALVHNPSHAPAAADLGVDVVFCGHTHGGQCRPHPGVALANSCDLPRRLTSGLLRHRGTQIVISRGLGEIALPLRVFCPPQLPVYTLRKRSMPGKATDGMQMIRWW